MTATTRTPRHSGAVVWIDDDQAIITTADAAGRPLVEQLARRPHESGSAFDVRAVEAVEDRDQVTVTGPAFSRVAFERAFVAVTHRPDRLVDVEPEIVPAAGAATGATR